MTGNTGMAGTDWHMNWNEIRGVAYLFKTNLVPYLPVGFKTWYLHYFLQHFDTGTAGAR